MATKQYIALLDADGCIYNSQYHTLARYLAVKYFNFFHSYNKTLTFTAEQLVLFNEVLATMMKDVSSAYSYLRHTLAIHIPDTYESLQNEITTLLQSVNSADAVTEFLLNNLLLLTRLGESGLAIIREVLYVSNLPFFASILEKMTHFDELVLVCGSLRHNFHNEKINMMKHGTRMYQVDLELIAEKFTALLPDKHCKLDKFILATMRDKNAHHKIRRAFEALVAMTSYEANHHGHKTDRSKFVLLYAVMHYLVLKYPHKRKTLGFYDDLDEQLVILCKRLLDYPQFHPRLKVEFACYDGYEAPNFFNENDIYYHYADVLELDANDIRKVDVPRIMQIKGKSLPHHDYTIIAKHLIKAVSRREDGARFVALDLDFSAFIAEHLQPLPIATNHTRLFTQASGIGNVVVSDVPSVELNPTP